MQRGTEDAAAERDMQQKSTPSEDGGEVGSGLVLGWVWELAEDKVLGMELGCVSGLSCACTNGEGVCCVHGADVEGR